jgi:spermidine synthase
MLAYMPYFFNPDPSSVLVLGFGLGVTASTFDLPGIDSINVVEICPSVIRASAQHFSLVNDKLIENEKLRLIIEDGRSWLQRTEEKYDVITCDAIHPRHGNNLYTQEYYEACLPKLKEGGTVCQWMPTNWLTEKEFQGLLKAFVSVFPDASLWYVNRGVSLMVGSKGKHVLDYPLLEKRMKYPSVRGDFADVDIFNPEQLLARSLMTSEQVQEYVKGVPANTDDYPYVEFGTRISMAPSGGVLEAFIHSDMRHVDIIRDMPENAGEILERIEIYSKNMKGEIRNELRNIPREQAY